MLKYYFFLIFKICVVISHTVERICCPLQYPLLTQPVKNLPAMWDTWIRSLGQSGFNLIHSHVFNFFFFNFWLHWVFVDVRAFPSWGKWGLPSRFGPRASHCSGFSLFWSTGSGVHRLQWVAPGLCSTSLIVVAHSLSCSATCEIFPRQG